MLAGQCRGVQLPGFRALPSLAGPMASERQTLFPHKAGWGVAGSEVWDLAENLATQPGSV